MTTPIHNCTPTSLYLYYDEIGFLIYVGITSAGVERNRQHNSDKEWWKWVASQQVEHFDSRESAHEREIALIRKHSPPFNKQHNRNHRRLSAAYRAARAVDLYSTKEFLDLLSTRSQKQEFVATVETADWPAGEATLLSSVGDYLVTARLRQDDANPKRPIIEPNGTIIGKVFRFERVGRLVRLYARTRGNRVFGGLVIDLRSDGRIKKAVVC